MNPSGSWWSIHRLVSGGRHARYQGPDGAIGENSYTPDVEAQEVGRAPMSTEEIDFVEQFGARFGPFTGQSVELWFEWEGTRISVPLRFGVDD